MRILEKIELAKDEVRRQAAERERQYIARINGQLEEIERLNRCRDSERVSFEEQLIETRWPTKKLSEVELRLSQVIKVTDLSASKIQQFPQEDHFRLRQMQPFSFTCRHYTIATQFGKCSKQVVGFDDVSGDDAATFEIDQITADQRVAKILF